MPTAKILVKNVIKVDAAAELESASLSNNTVKNRIEVMSIDIADQVISGVKDSKVWVFYATGRVDGHNKRAQLLVYVRYTTQDNDVKTELLMSKGFSSPTKRKGCF